MTKLDLQWTSDLITGDREIDTHHRALFLTVQRLAVACNLGRGAELIDQTLTFLKGYAAEHFLAEDKHMVRLQYPYSETHRAAHRAFINRLETLTEELATGVDKRLVANNTAEFVSDWFRRHVKLVDMPLIEYMRGER